jgi:CubicO group peptidase (beta-lactamase class C family)
MKRFFAAALIALPLAVHADSSWKALDGSPRSAAAIEPEIRRIMAEAKVPGLAVAVINDGKVVYQQAFGYADPAKNTPLQSGTVMYGASLTKAAYAYMVMQLVNEGLFQLDTPVTELLKKPLPEYPDWTDLAADPRWKLFTPRMMLSHTTGMPNFRWINDDKKLDIKYPPGSRYVYSAEGLHILQLVIEERSGRSLTDLMQERVFDRFGMKDSSMVWRADYAGRVTAHFDKEGKEVKHSQRSRPRAAGSMDTTPADYARFLAGVLRGEGLPPARFNEMFSPQLAIVQPKQFPSHWPGETDANRPLGLSIGLGWPLYQSAAGPAFFKEGNDEGTNNFAIGFRNSRSGVLLMSNSSNGQSTFVPILEKLVGRTCLPWFWMNYIPYDQPQWNDPAWREKPPVITCQK